MFEQLEASRRQQQESHKDQLFELLEERFLRHVAESEGRLRGEIADSETRLRGEIGEIRGEMQAGFNRQQNQLAGQQQQIAGLGKEIGLARSDLGKQIGDVRADVHKQVADVHKHIARQTRWILTVAVAATVLFPAIQRVMEVLLP